MEQYAVKEILRELEAHRKSILAIGIVRRFGTLHLES